MLIRKIIHSKRLAQIHQKLMMYKSYSLLIYKLDLILFNSLIKETQTKLKKISPTMCSAKWLQSTLHLELAETHSCHHPKRHSINLKEVQENPSRLHNTNVKINARKEMLAGIKTKECSYCWKMEECGQISDRIYKSSASWADVSLEKLITEESINNVQPKYLEVSFSSVCNLKCAYCYPEVSSSIRNEFKKYGPYPTVVTKINSDQYENTRSQMIEMGADELLDKSFFEWWEKHLKTNLSNFRITGGEPLLHRNTFKILDDLLVTPFSTGINFAINSNLIIPEKIMMDLCSKVNIILDKKIIESFEIFTSIDTWGESAEFLRNGLDLELFKKNCFLLLENIKDCKLIFMVTYQFLSPFEFNQLCDFILLLREKFPKNYISIGISKLMNPKYLALEIDPHFIAPYVHENLKYMKQNIRSIEIKHGFTLAEINHLERIYQSLIVQDHDENINKYDFKLFIDEYCKRKCLSFDLSFKDFQKLLNWYNSISIN